MEPKKEKMKKDANVVSLGTPPKKRCGILRSLSFQFSSISVRGTLKKSTDGAETSASTPCKTKDREAAYDSTPEKDYEELGPIHGVQSFGVMLKKYKKKNRPAKWTKRFFVLKECFLLYYPTSFRKAFEKTRRIDLHPKNTLVGESLIRELESRGELLSEEKRSYEERLEAEAVARKAERERSLELARLKDELEEEREKLLRTTKKLKDDLQNVKNELKITNETKRTLEQEKIALNSKTEHLAANMQSLNIEKDKVETQLAGMLREREQFLLEHQNLSTAACQLRNRLMEIETKTNCIATEKEKIENLLALNEQKMADLEKERHYYTTQTKRLMETLKDISEQKEMTEGELREQQQARLGAEKQLQAAEKALEHLENALRLTGAQMSELQEHIMPDVHKLREFFEKCAEEARLEANSAGILRSALGARKSIRKSIRRSVRGASFRKTKGVEEDKNNNNNLGRVSLSRLGGVC